MDPADIAIIHRADIPDVLFAEFLDEVRAPGLDVVVASRPNDGGVYANVSWLIPPIVILFIARKYFETFLTEMAKDHYQILKKSLKRLVERCSDVKITLVGSQGKIPKAQPYSYFLAIYFDRDETSTYRFLVTNDVERVEADRAVDAFMDFLRAYYTDQLPSDLAEMLEAARPIGSTVLVAFNPATGRIEPFNPIAEEFGTGPQA